MVKQIAATLLLFYSFNFAQAQSTCLDLFVLNPNQSYIEKISSPHSIVYNSHWLRDKLFKEGMLEKLKTADPLNDHIPFLEEILIEAHKELYEKIMEEYGAILSRPTLIPEIEKEELLALKMKIAKLFGFKKATQQMTEKLSAERLKAVLQQRANLTSDEFYIYGNLEIYNALTNVLKARTESNTITLQFYNLYHKFVVEIFTPGYLYYKESPHRVQHMLKSSTIDSAETENFKITKNGKYFYFRTFADLDFFDFIELWPKVFPLGSIFQSKIRFDGNRITEDAASFQNHDKDHSERFIAEFEKLTSTQQASLVKIFNFLTKYRPKLTEEEQIILGSSLFISFHESYNLHSILTLFKEEAPSEHNFYDIRGFVASRAETAYDRLREKDDFGASYNLHNTNLPWFTRRLQSTLTKVVKAYEETAL